MRRLALLAALVLGGAAPAPAPRALLAYEIERAGGERALTAARVLAWRGIATVDAGGRTVRIGVDTVVEPFGYARSDTWLIDKPADRRSLLIEGDRGWVIAGGKRTAMAPAMLRHERQQYALYGLMRLVTLRDRAVSIRHGVDSVRGDCSSLIVDHPAATKTEMMFVDGRLATASNRVDSPGAGPPIAQEFAFSGEITSSGVRWPRSIAITHGGKPYFTLTLTHFAAGPTRAAIEPLRAAWR